MRLTVLWPALLVFAEEGDRKKNQVPRNANGALPRMPFSRN